jgi:hypothetical protein
VIDIDLGIGRGARHRAGPAILTHGYIDINGSYPVLEAGVRRRVSGRPPPLGERVSCWSRRWRWSTVRRPRADRPAVRQASRWPACGSSRRQGRCRRDARSRPWCASCTRKLGIETRPAAWRRSLRQPRLREIPSADAGLRLPQMGRHTAAARGPGAEVGRCRPNWRAIPCPPADMPLVGSCCATSCGSVRQRHALAPLW